MIKNSLEFEDRERLLDWLYALEECDMKDEIVLKTVRSYIHSDDNDVKQIAIMRLGCRAHDIQIKQFLIEILEAKVSAASSDEILVYSAAVNALVCLAYAHDFKRELSDRLMKLHADETVGEKITYLQAALKDL